MKGDSYASFQAAQELPDPPDEQDYISAYQASVLGSVIKRALEGDLSKDEKEELVAALLGSPTVHSIQGFILSEELLPMRKGKMWRVTDTKPGFEPAPPCILAIAIQEE